jgi:hypothetical protein
MSKSTPVEPVGRLYEIRAELEAKRKGPYVLTEDITLEPLTLGKAKKLSKVTGDDERLEILLGDKKEAVEALFEDRPFDEWFAFQKDLLEHLYGKGVLALPGGSQGS